jgi:hypothetical protein
MKTSVTTAATAATPTAAAVTGAVGSVTGNVGGNVAGSVGSVSGDTKQTADVATLITTVGVSGAGLTALATQASVNTIDDFLDTEIAAILADTNELQTDWANGGRLDLILDAASAPTAAAVADAVWDEALSGHTTAGTAGLALATASSGGVDPSVLADAIWDEALSGHATAGTTGKKLTDLANADLSGVATSAALATVAGYIDTEVASILAAVDTEVAAIKTKTDYLPSATAGAAGGVFIAGANAATSVTTALTANITGNLSGSVGSVTGAVGSVTGAVGSVTGAVGSVTGNVGGNVVGSVASVTAGVTLANDAITAAKFDESTAFPLTSVDTGATRVARTGADADTLETISDQLDAAVLDGVLFLGDTQIA